MNSPPTPPNTRRRWLWPVIALWLALMGFVAWYGNRVPDVWFDPAQAAPHAFDDPAVVARFAQALSTVVALEPASTSLFIRFAQPDCPCEQFVDGYHQLMQPLLRKQGFGVLTLQPEQMTQLAASLGQELWQWIPATPAILLLDHQRTVAYFGPYHQAGICNSENSYLEPVLAALQARQPVNIINTLVNGCFCHYPQTNASLLP